MVFSHLESSWVIYDNLCLRQLAQDNNSRNFLSHFLTAHDFRQFNVHDRYDTVSCKVSHYNNLHSYLIISSQLKSLSLVLINDILTANLTSPNFCQINLHDRFNAMTGYEFSDI